MLGFTMVRRVNLVRQQYTVAESHSWTKRLVAQVLFVLLRTRDRATNIGVTTNS